MNPESCTIISESRAARSITANQRLQQHGLLDGLTPSVKLCECEHKLAGTGAVFLQSLGLIHCNKCDGWQAIRWPLL